MATKQKIADWTREIWREENPRCFEGKLPCPVFHVINMGENEFFRGIRVDFAGLQFTVKGKHHLAINHRMVKTKKQLRSVVVHEMIHQLQLLQKSPRTRREHHGRFFIRHAFRIIIEHNIPIRIYFEK